MTSESEDTSYDYEAFGEIPGLEESVNNYDALKREIREKIKKALKNNVEMFDSFKTYYSSSFENCNIYLKLYLKLCREIVKEKKRSFEVFYGERYCEASCGHIELKCCQCRMYVERILRKKPHSVVKK